MRKHAHLAAMMCFMGNHVDKHGGSGWPGPCPTVASELSHVAAAGNGFTKHLHAVAPTFREHSASLLWGATGTVKLRRQFEMWSRKPQPFEPDIVYVGKDRTNTPRAATRELCLPGARIKMLQDKLVYTLVYG